MINIKISFPIFSGMMGTLSQTLIFTITSNLILHSLQAQILGQIENGQLKMAKEKGFYLENPGNEKMISANGKNSYIPQRIFIPRNEHELKEAIEIFLNIKKEHGNGIHLVPTGGGQKINPKISPQLSQGWSFDKHAHGKEGDFILSTAELKGLARDIVWDRDFNADNGQLTVSFYAGTTWGEAVEAINGRFGSDQFEFVPINAPTGREISLGGSLAAYTHSRSSSGLGGFFLDTVHSFDIMAVKDQIVTIIEASRTQNKDLFHSLPGSFGRGGIITTITLIFQRVPKGHYVTTTMIRVPSAQALQQRMELERERILKMRSENGDIVQCQVPFLSTGGLVSNSFKDFFAYVTDFEKDKRGPPLPIYQSPNWMMNLVYGLTQRFPRLSDFLAKNLIVLGGQEGVKNYSNLPLDNWIFFQDHFAESFKQERGRKRTSHITLILKSEDLSEVTRILKDVRNRQEFSGIAFELQDILPLPPSKALFAPTNPQFFPESDSYLAYTLSWPTDNLKRDQDFKTEILQNLRSGNLPGETRPLAWVHALKEYESVPIQQFLGSQSQILGEILDSHGINDDVFQNDVQRKMRLP